MPRLFSNPYLAMLFRLGAVLLIAWLVHQNTRRLTEKGQRPVLLSEVKGFLPDAHQLRINPKPNGGFLVIDQQKDLIGFTVRTMPQSKKIKGYSGPSDVLMVFDLDEKLKGISIRHSYDTPSHVEDVVKDYHFMEQWNGKTRPEIAAMIGWKPTKFHIVSGASRTSEAVVNSVSLRSAIGEDIKTSTGAFQFRWQDAVLILFTIAGLFLTFAKWPWLQRRKLWIHILMVIYIGLISGDLLAQSLIFSWVGHGIPWNQLSGLVFLATVSFVIPWSTGKPIYCTHICPHGHAQRWLMKLISARRKFHLGKDEKWSFSALPGLLLFTILIVTFLNLPIDLAGFEPFDAWSLKGVGIATVAVAVIGLIFSLFVPMGYCRYGCPTGFALDLVKRGKNGFRKNDWWLAGLVITSLVLYFQG